jgi:hypothetical protein
MVAVVETTGVYFDVKKNFSCPDNYLCIKCLYYQSYRQKPIYVHARCSNEPDGHTGF